MAYVWGILAIVLFLFSIVMFVGIINPNTFNKKLKEGQKPTTRKTAFISFVILGVLGIIFATIAAPTKAETEAAQTNPEPTVVTATITPTNEPAKTEAPVNLSITDFIKAATLKNFDSADIEFTAESGWLEIKAASRGGVTDGIAKDEIKKGVTDTLRDLKDRSEIKDVIFHITLPMTDKFGNVSDKVVVQGTFLEATRNKINWDNFSYSNIPDIADSYGGHFSK